MKNYVYRLCTDQENGWAARIPKGLLYLLSIFYGLAVHCVRFFYAKGIFKSRHVAKPVISIGNITVGGAGKTPLVEFIARSLKEMKIRPAILIRGYMDGQSSAEHQESIVSDEAMQLKESLADVPVYVGINRIKNAEEALKKDPPDIFLLDDGFQHWRMARNMDIVAIDTTRPFGNGQLLPRGILREPLSALKRADLCVLTKTNLGKDNLPAIRKVLQKENPQMAVVEAVYHPVGLVDLKEQNKMSDVLALKGQKVCVLCGIGNPQPFLDQLKSLGVEIADEFIFMDHYSYSAGDIDKVIHSCRDKGIKTIVTTHKDKMKLEKFLKDFPPELNVFYLKIKIEIVQGKDEFIQRIAHILHR